MGASAEGGHALRVQLVRDRLKGLAVGMHLSDALTEPGPVGHQGTPGRRATGAGRSQAPARALGQLVGLELSGCRQGAEGDLAGLGLRVEAEFCRYQAPAVTVEPAGQRAHRGGRGPKAVKPLHDQARGAAGGDLLQGVTQAGPLGVCAGRRSQVAHDGNQLQPTSLAGTTDCVGLTSELGLSRSVRLGADGHVAERAPADRRHRHVARNPSG